MPVCVPASAVRGVRMVKPASDVVYSVWPVYCDCAMKPPDRVGAWLCAAWSIFAASNLPTTTAATSAPCAR